MRVETLSEGRGGDLIEGRWKYFRLIIRAKEIAKVKKNYIGMKERGRRFRIWNFLC